MILCGSDSSSPAADALDVALVLARLRGDEEVLLAHVVDEAAAGEPGPARDARLAEARAAIDALAASRGAAPRIRVELLVGAPDAALLALAQAEGAELLVIANRSHGGSLLTLGTTAARVVAHAALPVLLVRDPAPWRAAAEGRRLRVLLALDDSATAGRAARWALALRQRAPLDLVAGEIYYTDEAAARYGLPPRALFDRDPEIERLMARDLLRQLDASAADGRGEIAARARRGLGRLGDHVIELAREEGADLIVVGTSQKTGLGRLGSVSTVVVNDAPQSVLCVPPGVAALPATVPPLRVALVATDLSTFAASAVPYAFAVTPPGGHVHLVHVTDAAAGSHPRGEPEAPDDGPGVAALRAEMLALVPPGAPQQVTAHVVHGGDAARAIAQAAARLGVDVICIASHGRSGLSRALVGSVADRLLRDTRLPVLVLRPGE